MTDTTEAFLQSVEAMNASAERFRLIHLRAVHNILAALDAVEGRDRQRFILNSVVELFNSEYPDTFAMVKGAKS